MHETYAVPADAPEGSVVLADLPVEPEVARDVEAVGAAREAGLPDWAKRPPPAEQESLRALNPSTLAMESATATPDSAFGRGRIMHRLLQSLPDVAQGERDRAAERYLANPQHNLSRAQQDEIRAEILGILNHPDFNILFDGDSRAEVPLTGQVGQTVISGQVDRLRVTPEAVWVLDYKTNRPPPQRAEDVPEAYIKQLAGYRAVLGDIYPERAIRCFLLWTYAARLMEVPDGILRRP
jgi:ATP-dependent helicase/nuclease subunit A